MTPRIKACTRKPYRRRNAAVIIFFILLSCFALVMAVYDFIKGNILFAVACLIALLLAATYVVIRVNTVFATSLSLERDSLCMKNWNNDFLPYDYDNKIKILSEFIPAPVKTTEIPIDEIQIVIIGTKNFIKRNVSPDDAFVKGVAPLEKSKDYYRKRSVSSMDIFYVRTYGGSCAYMPIAGFEASAVIKIVKTLWRKNADLTVKTGSKEYRALRFPK